MNDYQGFAYEKPEDGTYGDGNEGNFCPSGRGKAFTMSGAEVATLLVGAASVNTHGVVERVLILGGSTSAGAFLELTDSNDAASLVNKRYIRVPLASAGAGIGSFPQPIEFAFSEGLVATVTDASNIAEIAIQVGKIFTPAG